jgi:hypothetical protein
MRIDNDDHQCVPFLGVASCGHRVLDHLGEAYIFDLKGEQCLLAVNRKSEPVGYEWAGGNTEEGVSPQILS